MSKVTLLIDTEKSYKSVAHLVRSESNPQGPVIRYRANTFKLAQAAVNDLRKGTIKGMSDKDELVLAVLDTLTGLATRTRWELRAPADGFTDLTAASLKSTQGDWGDMSDRCGRLLEYANAWSDQENIPFLVLAHEGQRINETTQEKEGGPDLNNMLRGILLNNSDAAWRIWQEDKIIKLGDKSYPPDTHYLRLQTSQQFMTKKRIPRKFAEKLPAVVPDPNLVKLFQLLGEFSPLFWTVFGPQGGGKTTLACSLSDPDNYTEENLTLYKSIVAV